MEPPELVPLATRLDVHRDLHAGTKQAYQRRDVSKEEKECDANLVEMGNKVLCNHRNVVLGR
jgi:hypothetical protein